MREGTPDNVLLETVKKINEAENLVTSLRQQLRVKNDDERSSRMKHQIKQCLKSYLQCNLCNEIFIKVILLFKNFKIDWSIINYILYFLTQNLQLN